MGQRWGRGLEPLEKTGNSPGFAQRVIPSRRFAGSFRLPANTPNLGGVLRRGLGLHSDGRSEETLFRISIERTGEVTMGRPPCEISMRMR